MSHKKVFLTHDEAITYMIRRALEDGVCPVLHGIDGTIEVIEPDDFVKQPQEKT